MNQVDTTVVVQQQLTFADGEANISKDTAQTAYRDVTQNGMDISHFFERPIIIQRYTWDDETNFFKVVNPWFDYFSIPTVRQKLRGYSRMMCEGLEIDIRINCSPFRYSAILASYRPLFNYVKRIQWDSGEETTTYGIPNAEFSGGHIYEDGVYDPGDQQTALANVTPTGNILESFMARSQRQHAYVDVAANSGVKMVLPFMYPKEAMELDFSEFKTQDWDDEYIVRSYFMRALRGLGTLHLESLCPLRNLQAADISGCTVNLYVRPVGVKVWLSSGVAAYQPQGFTSMLSSLWKSKHEDNPVLSNVSEVKIDQIEEKEDISVETFAARKAIVAVVDWSSAVDAGGGLFAMPIQPCQRVRNRTTHAMALESLRHTLTPSAFLAMNYRMWRGTAKITIKAICSSHHRGRLRVSWEPNMASYQSVTGVSNSIIAPFDPYTQGYVWDLSTSSQVSFEVGFGSALSKLYVPPIANISGDTQLKYSYAVGVAGVLPVENFTTDNMRDYCNGVLMIHVENALQAPAPSIVTLVVEMSFPDLQLYDSLSQTSTMDAMEATNTGTGSNYSTSDLAEQNLYDNSWAILPTASTRSHTVDRYIPQGIGTVPDMLDKSEKLDFVFQPTTRVVNFDNSTREDLRDLICRELVYDTFSFEVPVAMELGSNTIANSRKFVSMYYPPYIVRALLPPIPGNFGTTSPCRGVSYDRGRVTGVDYGKVGYNVSLSGNSQFFSPNMCRTHFAMLFKECYVAYKSTFNWRFLPVAGNGINLEYIAVERVNETINMNSNTAYYGRNTAVPTPSTVSPYSKDVSLIGQESFPGMGNPLNVLIRPVSYNVGTTTVQPASEYDNPYWITMSGRSGSDFGINSMAQLRKRLNSFVGSFYSGGTYAKGHSPSVACRVPYFAKTRYLPSSCLAWAFADSNQELSSQMMLSMVTESRSSTVVATAHDAVGATNDAWSIVGGFPKRSTFHVVASVSPGSDFTVTKFVNVPNIYLLDADPYTTEATG